MISSPGIDGDRQFAGPSNLTNSFIHPAGQDSLPGKEFHGNKILMCSVKVLLKAAAVDPLEVFADGDPLASPTPRPI